MSEPTNQGAPASVTPNVSPETQSEVESSEAEGDEPEGAAAVSKEPKKEAVKEAKKRKFQLKVDGREEEVELDLDNEDEIKKHLQMSKAAQRRMQQFAEYEKGVKGLFETLRTDPLKVISDPRLSIPEEVRKKMAEAIINNEIEEMNKTPEQKEKERIQREYEALKKQYEDEKKAKEESDFQRLQEQYAKQFDSDITKAVGLAGLPKTPRTVKYMAEALEFCISNDLNLGPEDLAPYIKKQTLADFREVISSLPDEEFEDWLGKDQISRIRKRNLQKIKQVVAAPEQIKPTGENIKKKNEEPKQKIALKDFMRGLGKTS